MLELIALEIVTQRSYLTRVFTLFLSFHNPPLMAIP